MIAASSDQAREFRRATNEVRKAFSKSLFDGYQKIDQYALPESLRILRRILNQDILMVLFFPFLWALITSLVNPFIFKTIESDQWFLGFVFLFFFMQLLQIFGYLFRPDWMRYIFCRNAPDALLRLAERADRSITGDLMATAWVGRFAIPSLKRRYLEAAIGALVLRSSVEEARGWSKEALRWLRWRVRTSTDPQLRIGGLLLLSELSDPAVARLGQLAQFSPDERVRAAGEDVLQSLRGAR
jgi:hypothetical protein